MEGLIPLIYRAVIRNRGHQFYRNLSYDSSGKFSRGSYTTLPGDSPRPDNGHQGILLQNDRFAPIKALHSQNVSVLATGDRIASNPQKD
ncbi:hypothetical protein SUGI_0499000 [Cryptomeria japonica]|nr:hypothetical protein SUGI_0499000 [Cryptomeria japonica]